MKGVLSAHVGTDEVPGLVALVSHGGETYAEVLGSKSYGGAKVQRDSIFRVSSMTKPVTAAATMILVDEGRLELEESVDNPLPELSNRKVLRRIDAPLEDTVPGGRSITVKDLLTFTMGMGIISAPPRAYPIQRAMNDLHLGQGIPKPLIPPAPDEWIRRLGTLPLLHQPGEQWMYNTGPMFWGCLCGELQASHSSPSSRIDCSIRGMNDSGLSVPSSKLDRFVDSYWTNPATGKIEHYDAAKAGEWSRPPEFPSGDAGLVSTADDFLAFATMLLEEGSHKGRRILGEESVETMTKDHLTAEQKAASGFVPGFFAHFGWGFCMSVVTGHYPPKSVGTYGWDGGLGTSWFNDPKLGLTAILMTQQAQKSPDPAPVYADFWKSAYAALE
jgi:CubicO group peptidase (beta-lactamase class C family)